MTNAEAYKVARVKFLAAKEALRVANDAYMSANRDYEWATVNALADVEASVG